MSSVLRKDGSVITSSVIRSISGRGLAQRPFRCSIILSRSAHGARFGAPVRQFSCSPKRLATIPQPNVKTSSPEPLPPLSQHRKHKVDLKPGPIRPNGSSGLSSELVLPVKKSSDSTSTAKSSVASFQSTPPTGGIVDTAKRDVYDAIQRGILAPVPEGSSRIYSLYHNAKELFKFYFRGFKLIFTNRNQVKILEQRARSGGEPLTRWETRFIRISNEDVRKLIPFALVILIAEELVPVIVLYAPFLLPSTCILPSQKERIWSKKREKQRVFIAGCPEVFTELAKSGSEATTVDVLLSKQPLRPLNGFLGLSTYGPRFFQMRSLKQHLKHLGEDDVLLLRESRGANLTSIELRQALFDRGVLTDNVPQDSWDSLLKSWLSNVERIQANETLDPAQERLKLIVRNALGQH